MNFNQIFLDNLWRWKVGLPEKSATIQKENKPTLEELQKTEWSEEFESKMKNRLIFGAYRYGRMGHGSIPAGKPVYDRCNSIRARLERFENTGNAEWLIDIANMSLLIYEERVHKNFHLKHIDGDTEESYHDNILK